MKKDHPVFYLSSFLFFFHSANIIVVSFLPLYFEHIGKSGTQIGLLLAMGPLAAMIFQPFWGYVSDKLKTVKKILIFLLIGILASVPILFQTEDQWLLMILMVFFFSFASPVGALGDSLAQRTALNVGINFGSIRTWGSLGFALTGIFIGYVLRSIGIENLLFPYLIYISIALLLVLRVKDVKTENVAINLKDATKLIKNPKLVLFLFIMLFISITHRANDSYLSLFIKEIGGDESLVGWAWFIAVSSEAIVFATAQYWFRLLNELTFIIIASFIYALRWLLFFVIDSPTGIIIVQFTHGLTFGVFYLAGFHVVTKLIPETYRSTGHLLFTSTFFGLSGIVGSLVGGSVIEHFGANQLYLYLGLSALVGSIGLLYYRSYYLRKSDSVGAH